MYILKRQKIQKMSKYLETRLIFQAVRCAEITFSRIHYGTRFRRNGVNISIRNAINKGIVKVRIFTAGKLLPLQADMLTQRTEATENL
jgi:hypothetical protein